MSAPDIGLGIRFTQKFPYDTLCCNGDYCKVGCEDHTREKLLTFIASEITKAQVEVLTNIKSWAENQRTMHTQLAGEIIGNPDWHLGQVQQAENLIEFLNV